MCIINENMQGDNIINVFYKESGIETFNGRIVYTSDKINSQDVILVINY